MRQTSSAGTVYFVPDHLGSTRALTDSSGAVVESVSYDSFGNGSSHLARYGYTGREWDAEADLYYYRARWYEAQLGRFISEDPIGLRGGINLYAYVGNNPTGFIDPEGAQRADAKRFTREELETATGLRNQMASWKPVKPPMYPDNFNWWAAFWFNYTYNFKTPDWLTWCDNRFQEGLTVRGPRGQPLFQLGIPTAGLIRVTGPVSAAISMDLAIEQSINHVGGNAIMETTGNGLNFQFRSTTINALGEVETRIGRFDINPASRHVQQYGPHVNLETQINGRPVGVDPHTPINPSTIRPGDHP